MTLRRWVLRRWVPYALFALGCVLSLIVSWYVASATNARIRTAELADRTRFLNEAEKTRKQIDVSLNMDVELIRAGAAMIAATNEISQPEFRTFVAGLQLQSRYPGMEAIGFVERVLHRDVQSFRRSVVLDGITGLRGWSPAPAPEYYPVLFVEPRDGLSRSVGHDIGTDPFVREALERARDTGQPAASGRLDATSPFVQQQQTTFIVLVPVYRVGMPLLSVDDRRRALFGFVFSPFNASTLLHEIVASSSATVEVDVYDGKDARPAKLLAGGPTTRTPRTHESGHVIDAAGRDWLVVVRSTEASGLPGERPAVSPLVGGLSLSLLLLLITRAQVRAWEITARQEMELRASQKALRASEAQAQAADHAKDEFLATLSHELRTPLNTVLGWVAMLRSDSVQPDRWPHALAVIERNVRLQSDLIEDLLDISRIVTGKFRLRLRTIDLTPVVTAAVESQRPAAEAKQIQLRAPSARGPIHVRADENRLQQIVWNLISNAIKFTPPNGRVEVELTKVGNDVQLSVTDTGIGITAEFLPHVFERFRQADSSATRSHSGLGLGLAIVRHLVELQGGSIEAFSEGRDRGARFVIHFRQAIPSGSDSSTPLIARGQLPAGALKGVRVLVVDDDPNTRELLNEALSAAGANVIVTDSASAAFQALVEDGIDVLISDIAMPEEDGLSLIRKVRALPGEAGTTPAIALTAFARSDDHDRAVQAGYQAYFAKPVDLGEVQERIAELMRPDTRGAQ